MKAFDRFAVVLARIATAVNVRRVRVDDTDRLDHNGGTLCELWARVDALTGQHELVADELEGTLS